MVNLRNRSHAAGLYSVVSLAVAVIGGMLIAGSDSAVPVWTSGMPSPIAQVRVHGGADPFGAAKNLSGLSGTATHWVTMTGRQSFWTALIEGAIGEPVAFLPVDSF